MKPWLQEIRGAVMATAILVVVTGGMYPLVVFGIGRAGFRERAAGSLIVAPDGTVLGSRLIGQGFKSSRYFHSRPSAAGADGYDGTSSGGSNWGPTSRKLRDAITERIAEYRSQNGLGVSEPVPADAVTASGSGLDPHISVANAELQAPRVARERGWDVTRVRGLIRSHTEQSVLPFLGPPAVNVLTLNLALDRG